MHAHYALLPFSCSTEHHMARRNQRAVPSSSCCTVQDGKPTGGLRGMLSNARASLLARFAPRLEEPLPSSSSSSSHGAVPLPPPISMRSALPWLAGATAIASLALYAASVARSMGWQTWQQQPEPLPTAMAEAAAAIGLPEYAVRPHYSAELDPQLTQRRPRQPAAAAAAAAAQQQQQAAATVISRQAATRLVQQWLVSALLFVAAAESCLFVAAGAGSVALQGGRRHQRQSPNCCASSLPISRRASRQRPWGPTTRLSGCRRCDPRPFGLKLANPPASSCMLSATETSTCSLLPAHFVCKQQLARDVPACTLLLQVLAEPMLSPGSKPPRRCLMALPACSIPCPGPGGAHAECSQQTTSSLLDGTACLLNSLSRSWRSPC